MIYIISLFTVYVLNIVNLLPGTNVVNEFESSIKRFIFKLPLFSSTHLNLIPVLTDCVHNTVIQRRTYRVYRQHIVHLGIQLPDRGNFCNFTIRGCVLWKLMNGGTRDMCAYEGTYVCTLRVAKFISPETRACVCSMLTFLLSRHGLQDEKRGEIYDTTVETMINARQLDFLRAYLGSR